MPAITSSNVAQAIVKLVAADALPALQSNLVMGELVSRDFEASVAQTGDTVNIPIPPAMTANNNAEGGNVVTQNPNLGNAQIVLNTHAEATFQIPDVTKVLATPSLLALYMQPAIIAIAEKIESDLLALAPTFTANTALGAYGTALTEATVDAAETTLFKAKVKGLKYLVCDGNAYADLRKITRFSEFHTAGEAGVRALIDGTVGRIKDFAVFRSQLVKQNGSSPVQTNNLAFSRNAMALAIRRLPKPLPGTGAVAEYAELGGYSLRILMSYQPNTLAQQFTVDALYGCGKLRETDAVLVRS